MTTDINESHFKAIGIIEHAREIELWRVRDGRAGDEWLKYIDKWLEEAKKIDLADAKQRQGTY